MLSDLRSRVPVVARARAAAFVMAVAAALAAGSCDKVPLTAPSNATIKLYANTPIVPLGGTAQITATVMQTGGTTVHNGTVVSFTTSLGTIDPPEAETHDGKVTVTFRAGSQSGTAVINAYSGAASTTTTSGGTTTGGTTSGGTNAPAAGSGVTLLVGAAAAASVSVTASPGTVAAIGGTSTITATVFDANNNALPGVLVSFSTDVGSVSPGSATTDQNGQASTALSTFQTATVTAVAATSGQNQVKGTAKVTVNPAPTVSIGAPASTPTAGQSTSFTVTITAGTNGAPITRASVNFGDGSSAFNLGAANGAVTVSHTYQDEGTYTVSASATDASNQTVSTSVPLTVFPAVPFSLTVTAPSGKSGVALTISATPGAGAPTIDRYVWNFGDGTTAQTNVPAAPHTYTLPAGTTTPQQFIITVSAFGRDGRTGFGSTFVTITP